jgi:hypothetical protein
MDTIDVSKFDEKTALRHQRHVISSTMKQIYWETLHTFLAWTHHKDFRSMRDGLTW